MSESRTKTKEQAQFHLWHLPGRLPARPADRGTPARDAIQPSGPLLYCGVMKRVGGKGRVFVHPESLVGVESALGERSNWQTDEESGYTAGKARVGPHDGDLSMS